MVIFNSCVSHYQRVRTAKCWCQKCHSCTRISAWSAPSHPWPRHRIRARLGNPQSWCYGATAAIKISSWTHATSRTSREKQFPFTMSWILVSGTFVTALGIIWNQCILPMQLAEKSCRCMPLGPLDVPPTAALAAKGSSKDRREER